MTAEHPATARRRDLIVARRAMACEFSISFAAAQPEAVDAGLAALDEIDRVESLLSVYQDESELARLNRAAVRSPSRPSAELYRLLRFAACLGRATGGCFDCTTGALSRAWGFHTGPRRCPPPDELAAARAASGWRQVDFDDPSASIRFRTPGVEFNPGAIGKGYAIDRAAALLQRRFRIRNALLQGGQSSLRAIGDRVVAIGDPRGGKRPLAVVRLHDRALGTSGDDHQFFLHEGRRYGHILDPRTGIPASGLLSASATAPTAAEADALSTAFFVMGLDAAREFCRLHPKTGAILVAPPDTPTARPRIVIAGAAADEVLL